MDTFREELLRQCATATPLGRLSGAEQAVVLDWLIDGKHITLTGKPLERPLPAPRIVARNTDGSPIYDPGADPATHAAVKMPAA
jgi:hypothetical protein